MGKFFHDIFSEAPRVCTILILLAIYVATNFKPEIILGPIKLLFLAQPPKFVASNLAQVLPFMAGVILLDFGILLFVMLISYMLNVYKDDKDSSYIRSPICQGFLGDYFMIIILEELFARWLFMGVTPLLAGWLLWPSMIIGNALWALAHLHNYSDPKDRQIARVFPQFLGGVFYGWMYLKFGLPVTIATHLLHNAIICLENRDTIHKATAVMARNIWMSFYYITAGLMIFLLAEYQFGINLQVMYQDVIILLANPINKVQGYGFWYMSALLILVTAISSLLVSLLGSDVPITRRKEEHKPENIFYLGASSLFSAIKILLFFWFVSWIFQDMVARTICVLILYTATEDVRSDSGHSRVWIANFLPVQMLTGMIMGLSFWSGLALIFIWKIFNVFPEKIMASSDYQFRQTLEEIAEAIITVAQDNLNGLSYFLQRSKEIGEGLTRLFTR